MSSFFESLEIRVSEVDSLLCLGLDPRPQDLSAQTPLALRDFCLRLIEKTADQVAAVKPNSAFFEVFGAAGITVLQEVIQAIPDGIPVILDAKRGDIASSAQAYARAAFQGLGADAITASPYLGYDSLEPFLEDPNKGVFLLCKTSNPGSVDVQDLLLPSLGGIESTLYEHIARLAQTWNKNNNLGLVVGATQPEALCKVRMVAPDLWFLSPGVGAQGGDLQLALKSGLRPDGLGMLIPVSRSLSRAADPHQAAAELRQAINRERENLSLATTTPQKQSEIPSSQVTIHDSRFTTHESRFSTHDSRLSIPDSRFSPPDSRISSLANSLLDSGCVKFGQFTLKSGLLSPIYIDLRQLVGYPKVLAEVAAAYLPILKTLTFDRLAALPYAALPIAAAISLQGGWPMIYPRKEVKEYGTRAEIEGVYSTGERAVVIDDLATTGGSKFEAIEKLTDAGLVVTDVIVLIDRQSGAVEALAEKGFRMQAIFTLSQLLDIWESTGRIPLEKIAETRQFLNHQN